MNRITILPVLVSLVLACSEEPQTQDEPAATPPGESADTVYTNGTIYTVNEAQPWAEAMAVKDGRLVAVGTTTEMEAVTDESTALIDLGGRFVMPGVNDLHHDGIEIATDAVNPANLAIEGERIASQERLLDEIDAYAEANPDKPIIFVDGYPNGMFPGDNGPKELLDEIDSTRPIMVFNKGGHAFWGNSKALEAAGVTADTPDPVYGIIARKEGSTEPAGALHESAMQLFWNLVEAPGKDLFRKGVLADTARINSLGITGIRQAGVTQDQLDVVLEVDEAGELNAYYNMAFHWRTSYIARMEKDLEVVRAQILASRDVDTENVSAGAVKYYSDGSPSSKTAYLLEDYEGDLGNRSKLQMDDDLFVEEIAFWTQNGVTTMTHSVGDASARAYISAVEAAQEKHGQNGVRHHLTHSVLLHPDDIKRIPPLDMVIDMSPAIAAPMAFHNAYKHNFGARHEQFFPARAVIDAGAHFMVASDYAVGPDAPFVNAEVWHTRMNPFGEEEGVLGAHSAITLEEAIYAATLAGAYGLYMEDEFGSLQVGKRATFVVLNQNLFEIDPKNISETEVLQTYFNGRLVYDAEWQ